MANNENRDYIIGLLKIGAKYLLPVAKEAFREYRDRILEAHKVSAEERELLLGWIFDDAPDEPPAPPTETDEDRLYASLRFDGPMLTDEEIIEKGAQPGDIVKVSRLGAPPAWAVSRPDGRDHPDMKRDHVIVG